MTDQILILLQEHVFREWHLEGVRYDFMAHAYTAVCANDHLTIPVKIVSELFDNVETKDTRFTQRKIKRVLKEALKIELGPED